MKAANRIIEYTLTASEFDWEVRPGKIVPAWGFNQLVPGPVLKAKKGDTLKVTVINNLPESTVVHWHGIRLPAPMDGTGQVQPPIKPGESFEYQFEVPDAGTFWYHSHHNETVQVERGMYGGIIIEDENDPVVDDDRLLLLDDMKLTDENQFKKHGAIGRWMERHDGREGSTCLVNGKENTTIHMHAGQTERWRFVNTANARYFQLSLDGKAFQIIGTDGGLLETPQTVTELLITPGERFDILVGPFQPWEVFSLYSLPYQRNTSQKPKKNKYATVHVMDQKPSKAWIPSQLRAIPRLAPQHASISRKVKLSVGLNLKRGIDFLVNDDLHFLDAPVKVGDLQVWEVFNASLMDHPFHLHGFFFQVLEVNGKAPAFNAWKDTYNIPPRTKVKIAGIPDNRPGYWMYHCHILEHHEAGMMAHFEVIDPNKTVDSNREPHGCHARKNSK